MDTNKNYKIRNITDIEDDQQFKNLHSNRSKRRNLSNFRLCSCLENPLRRYKQNLHGNSSGSKVH